MASLEHIDLELGEALESMMVAASEIRLIDELKTDEQLKRIGKATIALWEIRDDIHCINPDIKPDHTEELDEDKVRYESLQEIHMKGCSAENAGNLKEAQKIFAELLEISEYGFFKRLAEAGLYRTSV